MATMLPVNFECPVSIKPADENGNPAPVENINWSLNSTAASVFVDEGGMSAVVVPGDTAGETVQLTVTADARIGDGVRELSAMAEFTLVAAEAVNMGVSVGELRPKTAH